MTTTTKIILQDHIITTVPLYELEHLYVKKKFIQTCIYTVYIKNPDEQRNTDLRQNESKSIYLYNFKMQTNKHTYKQNKEGKIKYKS